VDEYAERLRALTAKLEPEAIGGTLIRAGCFLCAYELIQSEIVPKVRDFFLEGFNEQGYLYDEVGYNRTVRSLNPKNKFDASCNWLVARGALTAEQVATLKRVQAHRNDIAHKLPELLVDPDFEIQTDLLLAAVECLRSLGLFWSAIEVDTTPHWEVGEVDYEGIKTGSYLLMEYLISLAGLAVSPKQQQE
jgi:hypothetical protein